MAGTTKSGRRPGFKHSVDTREKMSEAHLGTHLSKRSRNKISRSNRTHLEEKCNRRFEDLKSFYPTEGLFFEEHKPELLLAMRDIRTDKELMGIRLYIETAPLRSEEPYQYSSSSCFAAEDNMIALLDFKFFLEKSLG